VSFAVWIVCWLYIFFVLPIAKNLPDALNLLVLLLLIVSSWVFFLTAAMAKGYSYIIGIGLMMLNIVGAAILALLPDKSARLSSSAESPPLHKTRTRKLLTTYIGICVLVWFFIIYIGRAQPNPYFVPFPILPSAIAGLIAAAIAWTVPWPAMLAGDPFPPMREGFRRIALLGLGTGSLVWWLYVVVAFDLLTSVRPMSVFLFVMGPIVLLLIINIVTRLITWVRAGFQVPGKG
jgi:hypothetical protein